MDFFKTGTGCVPGGNIDLSIVSKLVCLYAVSSDKHCLFGISSWYQYNTIKRYYLLYFKISYLHIFNDKTFCVHS